MTTEERINELENRVASLERLTMPMVPLGPSLDHRPAGSQQAIDRIVKAAKLAIAESVPVDRSARVLASGAPIPETEDHREINPGTGQQKEYVVLSAAERAKGFVRPVRQSYVHKVCGAVTGMTRVIAETYARDPGFYSGTFCIQCRKHLPLTEFVWKGTDEQVGS